MFGDALPFWAEAGVDLTTGRVHEALDLSGHPANVDVRLRVPCRLIYVFSHAATLGWTEGTPLARRAFDHLRERAWQGPERGWARLLTPHGRVRDATPDLYDHAFVLFALAWLHRATGDSDTLAWAHETIDFLDAHMRHPTSRGFLHVNPAVGFRTQNPHMHLLEASLALYEASGHGRFAALAGELADLFEARFFDRGSGTLAEAYTDELRRVPGDAGRVVEPGHHFEWAWILATCERLLGRPMGACVRPLVAFAERYGVDPETGATYNAVRDDGVVLDGGSRTWPNTERIKAHLALFGLDGTDPRGPLESSLRLLLDRYLAHRPAGTWLDHFDASGRPVAVTIPAGTLYHLFLAFAELFRVEPQLRALGVREAV